MGVIIIGDNDLKTWCENNGEWGQQIMKEWSGLGENGQPIDIEEYGFGSFKDVQWICNEGHRWTEKVYNRTVRRRKCPHCLKQKRGLKSWCEKNKEYGQKLLSEWTGILPDGSTIDMDGVLIGSNKVVKWKCDKGHEWEERIIDRTRNIRLCPECSNRKMFNKGNINKLVKGQNDLKTWCENNGEWGKLLSEEWNKELNEIGIDSIERANKRIKYWWKCKECGHDFQMLVSARTSQLQGCPICSKKRAAKKNHENAINNGQDLLTWCFNNGTQGERLLKEWDVERNRKELGIEMNNITKGSDKKVYWVCSRCGKSFQCKVLHRTVFEVGCLHCNKRGTSFPEQYIHMALKQIYPNIINRGKALGKVEFDICIPEEKLCIEYGSDYWHKNKKERDDYKRELCNEYKVRLLQIYGGNKLKEEISNELIVYNIPNSYKKHIIQLNTIIEYIVKMLGHSISEVDFDEALKNAYSAINDVIGNNFTNEFPELLKEWNSKLNPEMFTKGSNKPIKWKCTMCGNIWENSIKNRINFLSGCPHCGYCIFDNEIHINGIRYRESIDITNPELIKEWYDKEDMKNYTAGSGYRAMWKCIKCNNIWNVSIHSRVNKRCGCPECHYNIFEGK